MRRPPPALLIAGLIVAVAVLCVLSMMSGKAAVPFSAWFNAADPRAAIIFELRLPRTILGVAVGIALGVSGAALQGYTRNPLADPGVLGVSSMAALGAVLSLYLNMTLDSPVILPLMAVAGAGIGVVMLLGLSGSNNSLVTFVLAGMVLNTVAQAGLSLALSLAPNPWAVNEIVNWLMGSLQDRSMDEIKIALPLIAVGVALLLTTRRGLDALTLGDVGARSLGVDIARVRWILAIGVGLAAGASVAVTGVIGFVGLVVPHLMRPLVGARPGALLIPSGLAGAVIILAADIVVRLTPSVTEVKLGIAMAALGGPFFLVLLLRMRRRMA